MTAAFLAPYPAPFVAEVTISTAWFVLGVIALACMTVILYAAFFARGLKYKIEHPSWEDGDVEKFLCMVEALTDSKLHRKTDIDVFTNGENYYEAELEAIRNAQHSIHLEAYIFQQGKVADRFVEALTQRARSGVTVRMTADALGSAGLTKSYLEPLRRAGGKVEWYHPFRIPKLPHYNNRTHRELLIVDGKTAFLGGSGWADHWLISTEKRKRWRDTMVRVRGDALSALQAVFAENWLEACGELLVGYPYFPAEESQNNTAALVVQSTPSAGGSTRARMLFQLLLASASKSVHITTPYFLPDRSMSDELIRAMRERNVEVTILVPGAKSDHLLTRSSSRMAYGRLLKHGARIFEYQPAMIHAKVLIIDGVWSVVGSTNFDNRSFGINDEVNLAVRDERLAERLEQDFVRDLAHSREITLETWRKRPVFERVPELLGWVLERQE
jgi:cardiolipin synthase